MVQSPCILARHHDIQARQVIRQPVFQRQLDGDAWSAIHSYRQKEANVVPDRALPSSRDDEDSRRDGRSA